VKDKNNSTSSEQKIAFYDRLQEELEKNTDWPTKYMYKFIMPNKDSNLEKIKNHFSDKNIDFKKKYSKTGKYISITIVKEEEKPQDVINNYKSVEDIEGLVAL